MNIQPLHTAHLTTEYFEQLFFEYQPRLVRFAVRYLDEETAISIEDNFADVCGALETLLPIHISHEDNLYTINAQ